MPQIELSMPSFLDVEIFRSLAQLGSRSNRKSSTDFLSWLPRRSRSRYLIQFLMNPQFLIQFLLAIFGNG